MASWNSGHWHKQMPCLWAWPAGSTAPRSCAHFTDGETDASWCHHSGKMGRGARFVGRQSLSPPAIVSLPPEAICTRGADSSSPKSSRWDLGRHLPAREQRMTARLRTWPPWTGDLPTFVPVSYPLCIGGHRQYCLIVVPNPHLGGTCQLRPWLVF